MLDDDRSSTHQERFPIRLQLRHGVYHRHLYDVEGALLVGLSGNPLHVFNGELKDEIDAKRVRCIRDIRCGYRYFVTSVEQWNRFMEHRKYGSLYFRVTYHIYPDEDMDFLPLLSQGIDIIPISHRW